MDFLFASEKKVIDFQVDQILISAWRKLSKIPGGKKIFSKLLSRLVPYSGSIDPYVESLSPGHAKISIKDKRAYRNHLGSIHALAILNLGEIATGLPLVMGLHSNQRAILTHIECDYIKKARGSIFAISNFSIPKDGLEQDLEISSAIFDRQTDIVANVRTIWKIGKKKEPKEQFAIIVEQGH